MRTFRNIGTFRNHVSAHHSDYLNFGNYSSYEDNDNEGEDIIDAFDNSGPLDDDATVTPFFDDTFLATKKSAALFLLSLKEKQKLTQVSLDKVIEGVTGLFQEQLSSLHSQIRSKLEEAGVDTATISGLSELFDQENVKHPFLGLETQHQQMKFYKENFTFVVSNYYCILSM